MGVREGTELRVRMGEGRTARERAGEKGSATKPEKIKMKQRNLV